MSCAIILKLKFPCVPRIIITQLLRNCCALLITKIFVPHMHFRPRRILPFKVFTCRADIFSANWVARLNRCHITSRTWSLLTLVSPRPETNSITARGIALARGSECDILIAWGSIINNVHARERLTRILSCRQRENRNNEII